LKFERSTFRIRVDRAEVCNKNVIRERERERVSKSGVTPNGAVTSEGLRGGIL
jgi:hypothetical protein